MSRIFNSVSMRKRGSNTFNLSHDRKQSMNFGFITPFLCREAIPDDKWTISSAQLLRFAPLIAPIMHDVKVYTHYFFVPNRILWDNWKDFITGGEDGLQTPAMPTITLDEDKTIQGKLPDYLCSIPPLAAGQTKTVQAMPFAAYQMIYNEYYRDQNLVNEVPNELVDGDNTTNLQDLVGFRRRAFPKDYFTSALPWTQKGPEATIPLGDTAPIQFQAQTSSGTPVYDTNGNPLITQHPVEAGPGGLTQEDPAPLSTPIQLDVSAQHLVDLSTATAATINDLRRAFRLQEWLEKNARGGSRYTESLLVHFNVKSQDSRLQRPEYIGGGVSPVKFSEVLQTSASNSDVQEFTTPQANMAGHGINVGANSPVSYYCFEHGWIIGLMSVMPKASYYQGLEKQFTKMDKFDYYWNDFANLGEQPIQNQELYLDPADGLDEETFGYTPRYAEYKFINPSVHGDFRDTLDFWHLARHFSTRPTLNNIFIQVESSDYDDRFAVTEQAYDKLWVQIFNQITCRRQMPVFGTPTI